MANIVEELENQALSRNPIQDPAKKTGKEVGRDSLSPVQNPFDAMTLTQGLQEVVQPKTPTRGKTLLETLSKTASVQEKALSTTSGLANALNQAGLGSLIQNLTFDTMGKLQLFAGLQREFGDNFERNPVARKIIAIFEKNSPEEETKETRAREQRRLATSQRTLDALLGGT